MKHTPPASQGLKFAKKNPVVDQFKKDEAERLLMCKNYCSDSVELRYSMLPKACKDTMQISDFSEHFSCAYSIPYWSATVDLPPSLVPQDEPKSQPEPKKTPPSPNEYQAGRAPFPPAP